MGPYTDGSSPSCFAVIIVASIANGQANVIFLYECNCFLKVGYVGGVDSVRYIIAHHTRSASGKEWVAAIIREL